MTGRDPGPVLGKEEREGNQHVFMGNAYCAPNNMQAALQTPSHEILAQARGQLMFHLK